jgi:vancomycin resistance protein YoaR
MTIRRIFTSLSILLAAAAVAAGGLWVWDTRAHEGRVYPGVSIEDLEIGGRPLPEATRQAAARAAEGAARTIRLRAGRETFAVTAERLGLLVDATRAVRDAYAVGRQDSLWDRAVSRVELLRSPVRVELAARVDRARLTDALARVANRVGTKPEDARLTVVEGKVHIVAGRDGLGIDPVSVAPSVERAVLAGESSVDLPLTAIPPALTTERVSALGITDVVASHTTRFPNIRNRNYNIGLAARALRGRLLNTGDTLSFNEAVGPRTKAAGYLEAPVIIDDEFVPGDGGGVCQVSSTLFNAAALAGLVIQERSNHSSPVSCLPIGRDATVVYGYLDLKLRNDGPPLLLWTEIVGRTITVSFYGAPRPDGQRVELLISNLETYPAPAGVIERRDRDLPAGTVKVIKARPGYRATTWRVVRASGAEVRREVIARSFYRPVAEIRRIGVRPYERGDERSEPASVWPNRRVFP